MIFFNAISVFIVVNASLAWLNTVVLACTKSRFPCFLLVSRVWDISSCIRSCFPLAVGLCKFYANAEANPLLSILHNYYLLLISRNDKNKQLTLLGQRKLALTERNTMFAI
jgi:hypothetical protein